MCNIKKIMNFKDSLGGNARTMMIACLSPAETNFEETISTLKFASRMMKVENEAKVNLVKDPVLLVKKY